MHITKHKKEIKILKCRIRFRYCKNKFVSIQKILLAKEVSRIDIHFLPFTETIVKSLQNCVQDLGSNRKQFDNFRDVAIRQEI